MAAGQRQLVREGGCTAGRAQSLHRVALVVKLAAMLMGDTDWLISPTFRDHASGVALWWFAVLWLGSLGGCLGSFLTVVWDRRGTDRGIVFPPSHCEECGHSIRWYHNIPVWGWVLLGGRCRDCGARIPFKHPLIEGIFAAAFITVGILSPWL